MHDPIELHICTTDIPKSAYWKNHEGKVMLTLQVCERMKPSEKGTTHYGTIYDKEEKEKKYVAHGKFKPYQAPVVTDEDLPPGADQIEDAQVIDDGKDVPF